MRKCGSCQEEKDEVEFSNHTYCKMCKSEYNKKHYRENKQAYLDKARRSKDIRKDLIRKIKSVPCHDCKILYPFYVMEFDHKYDKEFNIAQGYNLNLERVQSEIAKCDVVCANCHRQRTYLRGYGVTDNIPAPEAVDSEFESQ